MNQTVTVIGHGFLGNHIAQHLEAEGFTVYRAHHHNWPYVTVGGAGIINAAGFTGFPNVDQCEDQKQRCIEGNILWPLRLQHMSGVPVFHISSGCIYQGDNLYTETDAPNFTGSFYSLCKATAEAHLRPLLAENSYLFRVRMPFGKDEHPRNLLTKLKQYPRLVDATNSLSNIDDIAKVISHFVTHRPTPGVYNLVNPGRVSTRRIVERMGLAKEWFTGEAAFNKVVKAPRSNCTLSTRKLDQVYQVRTVADALEECIR